MSSLLPSSATMNGNITASNGTLQRSSVNNAAADALRKKMQQLRDELELVKDDLERSRKDYEKERHGREIVNLIFYLNLKYFLRIFRLKLKLVN